jgi:transcription elongation factor Elf1
MDYLTIPITESARRCGIAVSNYDRAEIEVNCPFCGDRKRHMSLNTSKNVFRCNRCGQSGNSVTLYAKIMNLDTKMAYRELTNTYITRIPVLSRCEPARQSDIKPLQDRHNAYCLIQQAIKEQ